MPYVVSNEVVALNADDANLPVIAYNNVVLTNNLDLDFWLEAFPPENLANPATHPPWKSDSTAEQYITVYSDGNSTIDYLAFVGHNFGSIGAKLTLYVTEDIGASPIVWTEIAFGGDSPPSYFPVNDDPLIFRFTPGLYQAVSLGIEDATNEPQAAVMYCGELLILERGIDIGAPHAVITHATKSSVASGRAESGVFLGRIVLTEWTESGGSFKHFTPSWFREHFLPFIAAAKQVPFFFAWNPAEYPEDVGYVWLMEDPTPATDPVTRRIEVNLKYQGVIA